MEPLLDERSKRIWAGMEAQRIGWGGLTLLGKATSLTRKTISKGMREIGKKFQKEGGQRKSGGGRKRKEVTLPGIVEQLEILVAPHTKGDPMRPLRWTSKSTYNLHFGEIKNDFKK